jgi:hypothetical protein
VKPVNTTKTIIPIIMVLAIIAGAVAMWYDTLKINATIETGKVKVKFSDWGCSDNGPDPQAEGFYNTEEKDVATCGIDVEVEDEEGNAVKLLVTLGNAYPGYSVSVTLIIDNIGTIPVKLLSYDIEGVDEDALSVSLSVPEDTQIDPGDSSTYTLHITVLQDAEENSTYTFEVELVFAQWNEVTTTGAD